MLKSYFKIVMLLLLLLQVSNCHHMLTTKAVLVLHNFLE